MANSNLENSDIGSVNKSQAPSKKKPDGGLNEVACSQPKATQKHQGTLKTRRHQHEMQTQLCAGRDIKQNQTGKLLWRDTGGIHWRILASRSGLILAEHSPGSMGKGYSAGYSAGSTARRDPSAKILSGLASYSGILSGRLGGLLWWAARRDPLAGGMLGGIHWRATLGYSAGYSAGSTGKPLWRDTLHWRAALAGYSAGSALAGYWAGPTGQLLWRDTRRDPLASRSDPLASRCGGILGRIQCRATLAGYSAGSTGEQLWRDTGRDPLASSSGGILGGIHWRAALAGYSAGSAGELLWLLWQDAGWGRGVEASQTRIPTQNLTTPSCRVGNNALENTEHHTFRISTFGLE